MTCFFAVKWCGAEDSGERKMNRREKVKVNVEHIIRISSRGRERFLS